VVAGRGAFAVDLDVVEHELEVGTHVPVHAGSERVHGAAGHAGIVQVDGVVAEAELPHAGAGIVGQAGGGYAVLVSPGLARQVPQSADVAAAAGEIAGTGAVAGDVRTHVLALQLHRAVHPQRFHAGGRDAVGVGHGAGVDEAVGRVGARAHAQAQGVGVGVVAGMRQAQVQDPALVVRRRPIGARGVTAAVRAVAGEFATEDAGGDAPACFGEAGADTEAARNREGVGGHRLGDEV